MHLAIGIVRSQIMRPVRVPSSRLEALRCRIRRPTLVHLGLSYPDVATKTGPRNRHETRLGEVLRKGLVASDVVELRRGFWWTDGVGLAVGVDAALCNACSLAATKGVALPGSFAFCRQSLSAPDDALSYMINCFSGYNVLNDTELRAHGTFK